jgi:hypothetical protein
MNLHGQYNESEEENTTTEKSCGQLIDEHKPMIMIVCMLSCVMIAIIVVVAVFLSLRK